MNSKELVTSKQGNAVAALANQKGITKAVFQEALNRGVIASFLDNLKESNILTVPYSRSIADSLIAGKYDWTNDSITDEKFGDKLTGTKDVETKMYHFGIDISSENAIAKMNAEGFRPATMKELLAYGEKNPEEQRKYPVVALGSVAEVSLDRHVGVLDGYGSGRVAGLYSWGDGWSGYYRFLAVRI